MPLILAGGALVGAINGAGVALFGVPPIIMTLAVNVILQGGILVYTGGTPQATAPALIQFLAVGRIGPVPVVAHHLGGCSRSPRRCSSRGRRSAASLYAVGSSADRGGVLGRADRADDRSSPTRSPASPPRSPACCSPATPAQAYLGMGDPYLFTSIAAVAIGGASILGGSGHYIGTIAGAFVLTILTGLLPALNLSNGALLIVYGAGHPDHGIAGERGILRSCRRDPRSAPARRQPEFRCEQG